MGSKEKGNSQKAEGEKIEEKKLLLFIVDDMWDPLGSSILNVSKAAGDRNKKKIAKNQSVEK
jgi:hypothetical protein